MLQTATAVVIFLVFGAPGFLAVHVWNVMVTRTKPDASYMTLRGFAYSAAWWALVMLVAITWVWWTDRWDQVEELCQIASKEDFEVSRSTVVAGMVLMAGVALATIVMPALAYGLGLALRKWPQIPAWLRLPHPTPSAWDYFFMTRGPSFVRVTLTDGTLIGGLWGKSSFATAYPHSRDLYLEVVWPVHEDGTFQEAVPEDNSGVWIPEGNIQYIETYMYGRTAVNDGQVNQRVSWHVKLVTWAFGSRQELGKDNGQRQKEATQLREDRQRVATSTGGRLAGATVSPRFVTDQAAEIGDRSSEAVGDSGEGPPLGEEGKEVATVPKD